MIIAVAPVCSPHCTTLTRAKPRGNHPGTLNLYNIFLRHRRPALCSGNSSFGGSGILGSSGSLWISFIRDGLRIYDVSNVLPTPLFVCKDFRILRFSVSPSPWMHDGAINISEAAPLPSFPRLISWQVGHAPSSSSAACGRSRWLAGIMPDARGLRLLLAREEQRDML